MEFADWFGYAGTFTGVSFMLPQVWLTWKTKSVEDLSWTMLVLFLFNCFFWFMYGFLLGRLPLMLVNGIAFFVTSFQITLKYLYRNNP